MGQRHQLFVIAKIGPRYRVLAAIHHQWLYGEYAVSACLRTLQVLRANTPLVRQDLESARRLDWELVKPIPDLPAGGRYRAMTNEERAAQRIAEIERSKQWQEQESMFPMIATCLIAGAQTSHRVHLLPITTGLRDCDNNDGLTFFDVTDPEAPRYCFTYGFQFTTSPLILDAIGYLTREDSDEDSEQSEDSEQYEDSEQAEDLEEAESGSDSSSALEVSLADVSLFASVSEVQELKRFTLIEADALSSVWPEEVLINQMRRLSSHQGPCAMDAETDHGHMYHSSLRTTAMRSVISQAAENGTVDPSWFLILPDAPEKAIGYLTASPDLVTTTSGLRLLCEALRAYRRIDLSHFPRFTTAHVLRIMSELPKSARGITLTLPPLDDLTLADVRLLAFSAHIDELHFGTTTGTELDTILEAVSGARLQGFSHPELFRSAFTADYRIKENTSGLVSFPPLAKLLDGQPISQAIFLGHTRSKNDPEAEFLPPDAPAWSQHLAAKYPGGEQHFDHYAGLGNLFLPHTDYLLPVPVLDMPLCAEKLVPRLYDAVASQLIGRVSFRGYADMGYGLASSLAVDESKQIGPLPAELLGSYEAKWSNNIEPPPKVKPIVHGEWTLLVCHQCKKGEYSITRHCWVTRSADGDFVCKTLKQFLELSMPEDAAARCLADLSARQSRPGSKLEKLSGDCGLVEAEEAVKATEMYNSAIDDFLVKVTKSGMLAAIRKDI